MVRLFYWTEAEHTAKHQGEQMLDKRAFDVFHENKSNTDSFDPLPCKGLSESFDGESANHYIFFSGKKYVRMSYNCVYLRLSIK